MKRISALSSAENCQRVKKIANALRGRDIKKMRHKTGEEAITEKKR